MQLSGSQLRIKKVSLSDLIGWLPVLFCLANLYRMTGHSAAPYVLTAVAAAVPGLYKGLVYKWKMSKPAVLTLGVFFITGYINYLFIGNLLLTDVALEVLFIGIALTMLLYPSTFIQGAACFYATAAFFLFAYATGRNTLLILESSRNYISVLLILSVFFYYSAIENANRGMGMIDLIPAAICFFLSIWAYGRGGILSCALLLALAGICWLLNYSDGDDRKKAVVMILVVVALAALLLTNLSLVDRFMNLGKWSQKGASGSDRFFIWGSYLSKAAESFVYMLFGAPLEQIPVIAGFGGNTHNSFIQLHAFNGLITFVLFFVYAAKAFFSETRNKYYLHAMLLVVIMLRGMTDKFIFGQYGMPVMIYLVLHPYFERRNLNEREARHA